MAVASLEPDDPRFLGGFRLLGRLGEGGQGIVYLGQGSDGRRVAVKLFKADVDPKARVRLAHELAACERVASFCTAHVISSDTESERPYVVSEYVDGPSLQERVEREGPLREGELDRLVVGTAAALTAIHGAGVLHRDLKPANVLLGPDGPRVVDFGVARPVDADMVTTHLVGTPAYLAPELLNGRSPSPATDVFAWAATMIFAATGRTAFGEDTIAAVLNRIAHGTPDLTGVPLRLRGLLNACLAKDPAQRPQARTLLMRLVDPSAQQGAQERVQESAEQRIEPPAEPQPRSEPRVQQWTTVLPLRERIGGRLFALAGTGLAALLLVITVGLVSLDREGAGGRRSPGPGTASSPADTPEPTVPDAFGGVWQGEATESEDGVEIAQLPIQLSLRPGQRNGRLELPADQCKGALDLVEAIGDELTFRLVFRTGDCLDGMVTLTRHGDGQLQYRWEQHGGVSAIEATLYRAA